MWEEILLRAVVLLARPIQAYETVAHAAKKTADFTTSFIERGASFIQNCALACLDVWDHCRFLWQDSISVRFLMRGALAFMAGYGAFVHVAPHASAAKKMAMEKVWNAFDSGVNKALAHLIGEGGQKEPPKAEKKPAQSNPIVGTRAPPVLIGQPQPALRPASVQIPKPAVLEGTFHACHAFSPQDAFITFEQGVLVGLRYPNRGTIISAVRGADAVTLVRTTAAAVKGKAGKVMSEAVFPRSSDGSVIVTKGTKKHAMATLGFVQKAVDDVTFRFGSGANPCFMPAPRKPTPPAVPKNSPSKISALAGHLQAA